MVKAKDAGYIKPILTKRKKILILILLVIKGIRKLAVTVESKRILGYSRYS